jgi:hypothetical protein
MDVASLKTTLDLFADRRGRIYTPAQEIADEKGWSRAMVQRGMALLATTGYLIRHTRYFQLLSPAVDPPPDAGQNRLDSRDQNCSPEREQKRSGGEQNCPPGSFARDPSLSVRFKEDRKTDPTDPVGSVPVPPKSPHPRVTTLPPDDLLPPAWIEAAKQERPDLAAVMQRVVQGFCDYHRDRNTKIFNLEALFLGWVRSERASKYQTQSLTPTQGNQTDGRNQADRPVHPDTADHVRVRGWSDYLRSFMDGSQPSAP